jgi:nitrite reductase/ring-hydroxylating ferredoxin subunit
LTTVKATPQKLCELSQIADGDSAGFIAERNGKRESFIVVRKKNVAFVYVNSCPHIGAPLDFSPGRFLNKDRTFIMCSTHGAIFRIDDGFCVSGPCAEQALTTVSVDIVEGSVFLLPY